MVQMDELHIPDRAAAGLAESSSRFSHWCLGVRGLVLGGASLIAIDQAQYARHLGASSYVAPIQKMWDSAPEPPPVLRVRTTRGLIAASLTLTKGAYA